MENSKVKKSIMLSGLVSTGGMFMAKLIGLAYTIPFSYILANDAYISMYGTAYNIYSYILNVFTAGFPFAISALVAKYTTKNNFKAVMTIQSMSLRFLIGLGAAGMVVMAFVVPFIAPLMTSNATNTVIMRNLLWLLSLAVFLVPVLSAYRGYIQGRREMTEYAFSQTFEQLFRVGFLLSAALLVVFVLHAERVWALYGAVLSTSVAAAAGIWQIHRYAKASLKEVAGQAKNQKAKVLDFKVLFREFIAISIPYMMVAILGYSDEIYNSLLLPAGIKMHNYTAAQFNTITATFNFSGSKLKAIPLVLAPGFTAALIPHISSALAVNDRKLIKRNVLECLNIVTFLALPVSFCIFIYAKPICNTLFYTDDLELAAYVTRWIAIEGFLGALTPVISNLLMALQMRRFVLKNLLTATILKGVLMVPLTMWLGFSGAVVASVVGNCYLDFMGLWKMHKEYNVPLKGYIQRFVLCAVCTVGMWATASMLASLGLNGLAASKLLCLLQMALNGLISMAVFAGLAFTFQLPQSIFHINMDAILGR